VQILHPFIGSAQQYAEEVSTPDRNRPDHCPQCPSLQPLIAHGFYSRTLAEAGFDGSIRVRRYLCRSCRRTVSLLPEFALNRELAIQGIMARIRKCEGRWPDARFCLTSGRRTFG
jgi:hypothetical protein